MDWDYETALAWLYGRQAIGIKLGLDKVHELLAGIDDPHRSFDTVHVAGTNGKGTVTHLVADILRRSGHRVGRFTSPHLIHFTERIAVDGEAIPRDAVARGLGVIRPVVEALDDAEKQPTFFEITTALAFWWFCEQRVDWAVIETGMGGRLDATNVLAPKATVITNVAADHQQFLGDTLADITFEKAGIMKQGVPLITAATGDALAALKATSHAHHVPMSVIGEDYHAIPDINGFRLVHPAGDAHYDLRAEGDHQLTNAAIAVAVADALRRQGIPIPATAVHQALAEVTVPGRMESFLLDPTQDAHPHTEVLLDGAHNPAAAGALRYHLGRRDWSAFALVVGFSADKQWQDMLDQWLPLAARVYATPLRSTRSLPTADIGAYVQRAGFPVVQCDDAADALRRAQVDGHTKVLVAGSLFLVGEARAVLLGTGLEEIGGAQ